MTKTQTLTKKAVSVFAALVMLLTVVLSGLSTVLTADATTPAYANWRSNDSRWSGVKYSDIAVNASNYNASMNVAFAQAVVHLGVGDTDESKFNPLIFYNALKKKHDSLSAVESALWITYTLNPAGLLHEYSSDITVESIDDTSYTKSNFSTLASKLRSNYTNGYVSVLCVNNTWVTVYNSSSSTAWIMDPSGKFSNLQYYMNDGAKVTCVYAFKSSATRRRTGWYDFNGTYEGKFYIKNLSTGKYLTVDGNKDADATNVSVAALTGAKGQVWTLSNGTDGYKITPGCSTKRTLNPYADLVKVGTNVNIYAGSGETQEWLINIYSGYVYIQNCQNTNCALTASGTNVNVTSLSLAKNQQWKLEPAFDTEAVSGKYYMKNKSTGTYLYAGGTASKSAVKLGAKKETSAYQMNISMVTSGNSVKGGYITPVSGSVVLNPYADKPQSGTTVNLYTKNTDGTQYWVFEPVSGGYIVHLGYNTDLALTASGSGVNITKSSKANTQIWSLEKVTAAPVTTTTAKPAAPTTTTVTTKPIPVDQFNGNGTEDDPYQIANKVDLEKMRDFINDPDYSSHYGTAYYIQTADIDLENDEWTPIGICQTEDNGIKSFDGNKSFDGVYDGNKHKITNLNADFDGLYVGLFGRTQRHSIIKNLSVYGNVTGNGSCTGGIIGEVGYGGKVLNCSFNGTVTGEQLVGGITSSLQGGGTVSGCYVNAAVNTSSSGNNAWAGGVVGRPHVGHASNSENAEISNCYFVGSVSGAGTGAIVGKTVIETTKNNTVTYSNNYFLKSDGLAPSADESVVSNNGRELSEEMMKNSYELLGTPFVLNKNNDLNDGYPVFEWQLILRGDANCDGKVTIADSTAILQSLGNPDKYGLSESGKVNADCCNPGDGVSTADALSIQKLDANIIDSLPEIIK